MQLLQHLAFCPFLTDCPFFQQTCNSPDPCADTGNAPEILVEAGGDQCCPDGLTFDPIQGCVCTSQCCSNSDCGSDQTCQNGSCVCASQCCSDADCSVDETCVNGMCTSVCNQQCCSDN